MCELKVGIITERKLVYRLSFLLPVKLLALFQGLLSVFNFISWHAIIFFRQENNCLARVPKDNEMKHDSNSTASITELKAA